MSWRGNEQGHTYSNEHAHWRCGDCLRKWKWGDGGHLRLLVAGERKDPRVFVSVLGYIPNELEVQMGILKTGKLLEQIEGKPVTKEAILAGIHSLNAACSEQLGQWLPSISVLAQDPAEASDVPIYCENPRLSLQAPGIRYMAFKRDEAIGLDPISPEKLQLLLGLCFSFLAVDCPNGRASRRAYWSLAEAAERARSML